MKRIERDEKILFRACPREEREGKTCAGMNNGWSNQGQSS